MTSSSKPPTSANHAARIRANPAETATWDVASRARAEGKRKGMAVRYFRRIASRNRASKQARSGSEPPGSQRAGRDATQGGPHAFQRGPHGRVGREVTLFPGVLTGAVEFLAGLTLMADILPLAVNQGGRRPTRLLQPSRRI